MVQGPNKLSAVDALAAMRAGLLTAEALARACLERIALRDAVVRAFVHVDPERVLAEARLRDRMDPTGSRTPLHGLPFGVKDIIDTHDMPTAYGSPIHAGFRPNADAACVALAREAGAVMLGKTVTTEFALRYPGATTNPHNAAHTPGGSSSGSAAAVADCMVPVAFGTQTGGSIIRPASYCGVVGYKPSYGTINPTGVKPLANSFDTVGVFARRQIRDGEGGEFGGEGIGIHVARDSELDHRKIAEAEGDDLWRDARGQSGLDPVESELHLLL